MKTTRLVFAALLLATVAAAATTATAAARASSTADEPIATRDDHFALAMTQEHVLDVVANDWLSPAQRAVATLTVDADAAHGEARVDAGGTADGGDDRIVYQPAPGYAGPDGFAYRLCHGTQCAVGRATLMVRAFPAIELTVDGTDGFRDVTLSGGPALPAARFAATAMRAAYEVDTYVDADATPRTPWDGGPGVKDVFASVYIGDQEFRHAITNGDTRWRVVVIARGIGGDIDLYAGGVHTASSLYPSDVRCVSAMSTDGVERCEFEHSSYGSFVAWVRVHNQAGVAVAADIDIYASPIADGATSFAATGPGHVAEGEPFDLRVAYGARRMLDRDSALGFVRVFDGATGYDMVPVRLLRDGGAQGALALVPGRPQQVFLDFEESLPRVFVDVPVGATSLTLTVGSDRENVRAWVTHRPFGAGPSIPASAPYLQGIRRGVRYMSGETFRIDGAELVPGRWYLAMDHIAGVGRTSHATITAELQVGAAPPVRPGSYFNPQRGGHGVFLYPAGDQWTGLWYTYFQDGTPTWLYLQGDAPGTDGRWHATIHRAAWHGGARSLTVVGEAMFTATAPDEFQWTYRLDQQTGSESMKALGRGCPLLAGAPLDASSTWFDPARAGTGYSSQLWGGAAPYEYIAAFVYDARGVPRFLTAETAGDVAAGATVDLEQLTGFCPLCTRTGDPARTVVGTLDRSYAGGTLATILLEATYANGVPGVWAAEDDVVPLGGDGATQGCAL